MRRHPPSRKSLLLLALTACWWSMPASALHQQTGLERYARQVWSTDNGLPQNSAHAILQTSDDFLWIATEGGLARFDGYQFRIFDTETLPRLPGNDVRSLMEDRSGALWVGSTAGVTRLKGESAQSYTTTDGLPSATVRSTLQTSDGTLWVLTAAGLASANNVDPGKKIAFHAYSRTDGMLSDTINAIADDGHGGLWVGTSQGLNHIVAGHVESGPKELIGTPIVALGSGIKTNDVKTNAAPPEHLLLATPDAVLSLANGVLTSVATQPSLPLGGVLSLIEAPEGVWIAGKSGVTLIGSTSQKRYVMGRDLPGTQVYTMTRDRSDALWIGTNAGLGRWFEGQMQAIASGGEAGFSSVLTLYEDREGDLWTGTETGGVGVLRDPLFNILDRRQGLADGAVTSVSQAGDKSLWIGTSGSGLNQFNLADNTNRLYQATAALSSNRVLSLASNGASSPALAQLWVGTPDGLNLLQDGRWKLYTSADGLADDLARSLLVAQNGDLWIGSRRGLTRWRAEHGTTWTVADGLGSDLVGAMVQDATGDLWIGTLGGLSRMHDEKIQTFTTADGLPSNTVTALAASEGRLWIGTRDQGLALRDAHGLFTFTAAAHLPRNISAILPDGLGSIWLSSDRGIYRVELASLDAFHAGRSNDVAVISYGTGDGLPSLEGSGANHPSAWRLADGRLCFASRRGVVLFDPKNMEDTASSMRVVLEQMEIDGRSVSAEEMRSIAPGVSHLSFSFAGINLSAPQRVQYRYMLEGFDKEWVEAGTQRTAFYTNLSPGRYRFRVTARISGGPWSEPGAAFSMRLRPHFYQTALFGVALALLTAALLFGLYRLRVKTLQERFKAVAAERSRLAREIHDTLAQGFVAVSVRLEIMAQLLRKQSVDACRDQLDQTRSLVRDSLAEARRSIWDLRAEGADSMSLPARLARSVQQTVAAGTPARFETTGTYRPLDRSVEDELFRIAQEAITNALRHAQAHLIQIRLAYTAELASLEVMDDGCGFEIAHAPSSQQGHFGLVGMHERAHKIGATVILESSVKLGTTVRVEKRLSTR
jgi:ligand-binding sensor domain-containing protein/signal transduction histidine kinase